jgi:hypothetical protein
LGRRPTAGYSILIRDVAIGRDGVAVVRLREQRPTPGRLISPVLTSPWVLVRVDRSAQSFAIEFEDESRS